MSRPRVAILASGEGTTAEAVSQQLPIGLVICNKPTAGVLARMSKLNILCKLAVNDQELETLLEEFKPDLIVLMGYMKKVPARLVHTYRNRILNTHPGLLPATKGLYGLGVQHYVLDNKLPYAGQSLHIVTENYDEGPVIAEHKIEVLPGDTPESLFSRVRQVEKQFLAGDIINFLKQQHIWQASS